MSHSAPWLAGGQTTTLAGAVRRPIATLAGGARGRLSWFLASPALKTVLMVVLDGIAIAAVLLLLEVPHWQWLGLTLQGAILVKAGYKPLDRLRPERELEIVVKSGFWALLVAAGLTFFGDPARTLVAAPAAMAATGCSRVLLRSGFQQLWKCNWGRQRAMVVGECLARQVEVLLRIQRYRGVQLLGYLSAAGEKPAGGTLLCLGNSSAAENMVRRLCPDLVIIPVSACGRALAARLAPYAEVVDDAGNPVFSHWDGRHDFLHPRPPDISPGAARLHRAGKRLMDVVVGLLGCLLTSLLWPLIALAIKLDDGGPVLYRQQHLAAPGRLSRYWKFRTMRVNAAALLQHDAALRQAFAHNFKLKEDPRITRVGRFLRHYSLDELPALFNVLQGTLSLVGPRTLSVAEAARYGPALATVLSARPGITGFWQVMGRQTTTYEERIAMDLFYVVHRSPWLDWWIVARTFGSVITAEGAY